MSRWNPRTMIRVGSRRGAREAAAPAPAPRQPHLIYSPADRAAVVSTMDLAGAYTVGVRFNASVPDLLVTGARVYAGTPRTIRVRLTYHEGGAGTQMLQTQVLEEAGLHDILFDEPVAIGPGQWTIAQFRLDVSTYQVWADIRPATPFADGPIVWHNFGMYIAGDGEPAGDAISERYPITPLLAYA